MSEGTKRVLGIGGVFFRAKDPAKLAAWYQKHLGFGTMDFGGAFGAMFPFADKEPGYQLWTAFPPETKKFEPSQAVMLNLRVADLDGLLATLRAEGVDVDEKTERGEYGNFGWVTDCEGNRIELWQPPAENPA